MTVLAHPVSHPPAVPARPEADRTSAWLLLTVPIVVLAVAGSAAALLDGGSYSHETSNWAAQATEQDIANLVVFPVMAVVAVFGLSVYALAGGIASLDLDAVRARFSPAAPVRSTSLALIGIAVVFSALWLAIEVPAALSGTPADELRDVGLFTNPVHVLDLGVALPATAIAGLLLRLRRPLGYCLAPLILSMLAALTVGIVALMLVAAHRGIDPLGPGIVVTSALMVAELVLLGRFLGSVDAPTAG